MTKKRALGRGLDALLGVGGTSPAPEPAQTPASAPRDLLRMIPVDLIQRGRYQPRLDIKPEALQELADSIKAQGVVQPVVVRPLAGQAGRFELIAGERRWRATQLAGLHEILRRQGLLLGRWCLDPNEELSAGQLEEIDRICANYPQLNDDEFVSENLAGWLS